MLRGRIAKGRYYVTDLVHPPDPHGFFGGYALGQDVSHGCIRVAIRVITTLAGRVPLGTPVTIAR